MGRFSGGDGALSASCRARRFRAVAALLRSQLRQNSSFSSEKQALFLPILLSRIIF